MTIAFSKTESISLNFSAWKHLPPIVKSLSTGPTINEHITSGQLQLLLTLRLYITITHTITWVPITITQSINFLLHVLLLLLLP